MDQLIRMVQERANIDEGQARTAVETVVGFLRERLPDPIAGQLDGILGGGAGGAEGGSSPMDQVSGILGRGG